MADQASTRPAVLIVGGAGYFGARLAEELAIDHSVTITQRSRSAERDAWVSRRGLRSVVFDSARSDTIMVDGQFDAIVNLAMASAAQAASDVAAVRGGALKAVDACMRLLDEGRARRLLHFSTFHVYGNGNRELFAETDAPAPASAYGHAHLACEERLAGDDRAWIVRPSNLVGVPAHADLRDQAKLLFVDLCRQAARGDIVLHNDGLSYRDFLPFGDAFAAVRLVLDAEPASVRLLNLARGESMRLDDAARLIQARSPRSPGVKFGSGQDAFRQPFTASTGRLRKLGWVPSGSLEDEAAGIVKFFS